MDVREPHVFKYFAGAVAVTVAAATGVSAQQSSPASDNARFHLFTMEGVLERAVQQGANRLSRQVQRLMPDMLLISGGAEARGFRLDGYGVFFDVEVPVLRRSVAWSLRTMVDDNGMAATTALQEFKAHVETIQAPSHRREAPSRRSRLSRRQQRHPPHCPRRRSRRPMRPC
jgi:hypothetical protein